MDIFSRLLKDRIIFIGMDITDQVANIIVAQLLFLRMEDSKKEIHIYINSVGGYTTSGLAIYDVMKWLPCDVCTYCIGQASSMAAILLAAGTKGKRYALPNSQIMLHQPSGGVGGTQADIAIQAERILDVKEQLNKILATETGQTYEKICRDVERDYFMNPEAAKAYGLVDNIIERNER